MILLWLSCGQYEEDVSYSTADVRRISLAIQGTLPSIEDYAHIQQHPRDIHTLIQEYLSSPWHQKRMLGLFSDWTRNRVDTYNITQNDYHLDSSQQYDFLQSVGEETPRTMAYYATHDEDWRDVVQSPFTMANDLLLSIWPLEAIETTDGWKKARYTDGRPPLGILMNNGLWWRYYTTPNNFNRARASVMADLFLCVDYLSRPISFEATALLEHEDFNEIIQNNEACIGCHNTLDPLAATFFGFWWYDIYDTAELSRYHPEREYLGEELLNTEIAYFGQPLASPSQLGMFVAQDPRFTQCTVQKLTEALWHQPKQNINFSALHTFHDQFVQSQYRISSLLTAIVLEPSFHETSSRMLSAQQLALTIEDLTGFVWKENDILLLENDIVGYRKMLGGADGNEITHPATTPSISRQLTLKRFAQAAAQHWAEQNTLPERFTDDDLYQELFLRLYGHPPSEERMEIDQEMWTQIAQQSSPKQAWISLLSVWLRDPLFWSY